MKMLRMKLRSAIFSEPASAQISAAAESHFSDS
jgi:hypothetical protein